MEVSFGELGVEMSVPGPGPTVAYLELAKTYQHHMLYRQTFIFTLWIIVKREMPVLKWSETIVAMVLVLSLVDKSFATDYKRYEINSVNKVCTVHIALQQHMPHNTQ